MLENLVYPVNLIPIEPRMDADLETRSEAVIVTALDRYSPRLHGGRQEVIHDLLLGRFDQVGGDVPR